MSLKNCFHPLKGFLHRCHLQEEGYSTPIPRPLIKSLPGPCLGCEATQETLPAEAKGVTGATPASPQAKQQSSLGEQEGRVRWGNRRKTVPESSSQGVCSKFNGVPKTQAEALIAEHVRSLLCFRKQV